ncbi:MAG: tRNA nucleotidyltransferase [Alphaproteobacteria bacterium]
MHPGLEILRLAALLAEGNALDEDALDVMFEQMETGAVASVAPSDIWPELARGLMSRSPALMIRALRECCVLGIVLPEVVCLFGVPQIADEPAEVDIGEHLMKSLVEAARCNAPLEVRFALLTMNVGKADSPREHLPVHYRHIERGRPRIEAICERFSVPAACRELALLALAECERVHRVSEVRAGPVAMLLDRTGAFSNPALFKLLMAVCSCDYFAYGGRSEASYPKAQLLNTALRVCADLDESELESADTADEVQAARAVAIAEAFRSARWSSDAT